VASAIITALAGMADRFATMLDRADIGFLPGGLLDPLPLPVHTATGRIAGIDLSKPGIRPPCPQRAPWPGPGGFTAAEFTAKVRHLTRHDGYITWQGRQRPQKTPREGPRAHTRPDTPPPRHAQAASTIAAALLARRDHVIAPILAGVRRPRMSANPKPGPTSTATTRTSASRLQTLFRHVGIETQPATA
jgi:hypothetical protein